MTRFFSKFTKFGLVGVVACSFVFPVWGQQQPTENGAAPFASENAILDTGIPFAIGAQEAQQSLRGSFGWPTFQEGLVQGVYFRFDPDGYARFAPTPRLDTDVFEVICRPRTYSCMGRKGSVSVILNSRGQLQLKIDDVAQGDRFFVSEGVSEIELPERVLQPLDTQLELLLSTGGDLIVRRGENEKDRISLTGFYPVSAYLRWVAARQDYTILPRGWPVPNSTANAGGMTQSSSWQSPMPQPQNFANAPATVGNNSQFRTQGDQIQVASSDTMNTKADVAEVKGELKILRELLLQRRNEDETIAPQQNTVGQMAGQNLAVSNSVTQEIEALREAAEQIQTDLARLTNVQQQPNPLLAENNFQPNNSADVQNAVQPTPVTNTSMNSAEKTAERLHYLMVEIGLDAKTALMLVQMNESEQKTPVQNGLLLKGNANVQSGSLASSVPKQKDVVAQILAELEGDITSQEDRSPTSVSPMSSNEYQLLSRYFKSVALPHQ